VLLPVVLRGRPLGAALISVISLDGAMLEDLRDSFAAVLMVNLLNRAVPAAERPKLGV
jgi:hypothetical protein